MGRLNGFWLYVTEQKREHRPEDADRVEKECHNTWPLLSTAEQDEYKARAVRMRGAPAPCPRTDCTQNTNTIAQQRQRITQLQEQITTLKHYNKTHIERNAKQAITIKHLEEQTDNIHCLEQTIHEHKTQIKELEEENDFLRTTKRFFQARSHKLHFKNRDWTQIQQENKYLKQQLSTLKNKLHRVHEDYLLMVKLIPKTEQPEDGSPHIIKLSKSKRRQLERRHGTEKLDFTDTDSDETLDLEFNRLNRTPSPSYSPPPSGFNN